MSIVGGDGNRLLSFGLRFASPVLPGQTLVVQSESLFDFFFFFFFFFSSFFD